MQQCTPYGCPDCQWYEGQPVLEHRLEDYKDTELKHCVVCGAAEGQLLLKCPGFKLSVEDNDRNYDIMMKRQHDRIQELRARRPDQSS